MLVAMPGLVGAAEDSSPAGEDLHRRITAIVEASEPLVFRQISWERKGDEAEANYTHGYWEGRDRVRMEVKEGRTTGAAILRGETVHGFKEGFLSFVKLRYELREDKVTSIRGYDLSHTGFMDDFQILLDNWDTAEVTRGNAHTIVSYSGYDGLPSRMWLPTDEGPLYPFLQKVWSSEGHLVELYVYWDVVYGAEIDPDKFEP